MVNKTRKRVRRQIRNKKLDKRLNVREIMHQKMMQNLLLTQPQQQQSNQLGLNIAQQELYNKERIVSDLNNKIEANKQEIKRKDEERKTYLETIKNQEIFISNMNRDTKKAEKSLKQQINSRGSMLTNDQLLLEHVLDLEARFAKMEMKTKKLKKKYKNLKHDIYVDTDEETPGALRTTFEPTEKQQIIDETPQITRPPVSNLRGWRARIAAQY